ncbi:MAG: FAD:protein FMN transferase, partial [Variovorax paradoxus]|nr:FAD:protein FMN transferase [Variovorax paradoxus]
MKRRQLLRLSLGLGALAGGAALAPAVTALHWGRRDLLGFGTTLSLQAGHEHEAVVER